MINDLGTQLSDLQINFGVLHIDTENSATGVNICIINRLIFIFTLNLGLFCTIIIDLQKTLMHNFKFQVSYVLV